MTEYDYSPDAPSLLSLYDGPLPSPSRPPPPHAQYEYNSIAYESPRFYRRLRHLLPPWLPVDPTNRNGVRGIEPVTGPRDSELSAMADLRISPRSHSLLDLLKMIYRDYAAGHPDALFRVCRKVSAARSQMGQAWGAEEVYRLKRILRRYEVPFSERPLSSSTARKRICTAGKAGIMRICEACYRLGAYIDLTKLRRYDLVLASEMADLKACCQRLDYLVRTGRACPRNRARVEKVLANIKMSVEPGDTEALQDRRDFSDLYLQFCELTLMGEDTAATIRYLRELVKDEHELATHRVDEFNALRKHYEDGGRRDLVVLMQENAKAARKAGFEGMASAEESQQIYDELAKIDRRLAKIGQTLRESKEFWEGVDRKLSPTPASQQTKDPPDGITTGPEELRIERHAEKIHAGLQTVHSTAQHCSKSKKIRKAGNKIVGDAATLTKNCTGVVQTQTSAEIQLHNPVCDRKSGHKALSPLKKGLGQLVTGYEKLSLRFTKYAEMIYLLVWFAGSAATDKLLMDKPEYVQVAQAELISKGLFTSSYSSYALPFEIAFSRLDRQLHEMRKVWSELVVRVDGLGAVLI